MDYKQLLYDRAESEEWTTEQARKWNNGWVPVDEQLPVGLPRVLVSWQDVVETAYCIDGVWYDDDDNEMVFGAPEAWQPLPQPYQSLKKI